MIHPYWFGLKMNGMQNMTNEKVMQILTDMGVHEGGMDNWVADNAWVKFAALVASAEREAIAKMVEPWLLHEYVEKIRNREQA